jgi:hypothetical protein
MTMEAVTGSSPWVSVIVWPAIEAANLTVTATGLWSARISVFFATPCLTMSYFKTPTAANP